MIRTSPARLALALALALASCDAAPPGPSAADCHTADSAVAPAPDATDAAVDDTAPPVDASPADAPSPADSAPPVDTLDPRPDVHAADTAGPHAGCVPHAAVLAPEVSNARDLGGTPLSPHGRVACGQLYRGGPLARLTAPGCAAFAALGVRTVIDLRTPNERLANPPAPCVPAQAQVLSAPMPIPYDVSPTAYRADLHAEEALRIAFGAFGDPDAYPVYFHCTYGRDRTGVLAAVILDLLGASRAEILADYQLTAAAGLSITPHSLEAVLDELDAVGGAEPYLLGIGVPASALALLRERAIAP